MAIEKLEKELVSLKERVQDLSPQKRVVQPSVRIPYPIPYRQEHSVAYVDLKDVGVAHLRNQILEGSYITCGCQA